MARRRRWVRKPKADMAWVVGDFGFVASVQAGDPPFMIEAFQLFNFSDIDNDGAAIVADKSDWFIKRAIINFAAVASLDGITTNDTSRMFQYMLGTQDAVVTNDLNTQETRLIEPFVYEKMARIFTTGVCPAYHMSSLPYGQDASSKTGIMVCFTTEATSESVGWVSTFDQWGPAYRELDVSVSNAGLKADQGVVFAISDMGGPAQHDWQVGDSLGINMTYQFLLQKRRT